MFIRNKQVRSLELILESVRRNNLGSIVINQHDTHVTVFCPSWNWVIDENGNILTKEEAFEWVRKTHNEAVSVESLLDEDDFAILEMDRMV